MIDYGILRYRLACLLAAFGAAFAASSASAAVSVAVSCSGNTICAPISGQSDNPRYPYVPGAIVHTSGAAAYNPTLIAESSARSSQGALGVSAFIEGMATGGGEAYAFAEWSDSFVVTSATLGAGTLVTARFTHVIDIADAFAFVDDSANIIPNRVVSTYSSAKLIFDFQGNSACLGPFAGRTDASPCANSAALHIGHNVLTDDVQLRVGQSVTLGATLVGQAFYYDSYSYSAGIGRAGVDALGTAHSYVSPLSPDVAIVSGSGASYLAPGVPEPGSWAMLVAGFGVIGATLRRRATALARA
jgi:hypothetical protein